MEVGMLESQYPIQYPLVVHKVLSDTRTNPIGIASKIRFICGFGYMGVSENRGP